MTADLRCEVCGMSMRPWRLDEHCVLTRCTACGHLGRDLQMAPAGARPDAATDAPGGPLRAAITARRWYRRSPLPVGSLILDLGCGPVPHVGEMLARDGYAVLALDPEIDGVDAGAAQRPQPGQLVAVRGTADDVGALPGPFDAVVAIHVLEHVPDPVRVSAQVLDALRPGGSFYALTPNGDSAALCRFGSAWWLLEDPTHVRFFSAMSLALAARDAGYADVTVRSLVTDSLASDVATAVRVWRGPTNPVDVQDLPMTSVLVAGFLPLTLAWRAAVPEWRPTLELLAVRGRTAPSL